VNYVLRMDLLDSLQNLTQHQNCVFEGEGSVGEFSEEIEEIAHIAVFEDEEVPICLWIGGGVPSNVLRSLTIFGWLRIAIVLIS
jgi:hypothetical protein